MTKQHTPRKAAARGQANPEPQAGRPPGQTIQAGKAFLRLAEKDPKAQLWERAISLAGRALEPLAKSVSEAGAAARAAQAEELRKLSAELDAAERRYEADWKKATGVVPPRWTGVDELETIAIPWWQEQAALAGIDPATILNAGEAVASFGPIIRGKLRLLHLQAATLAARRRRRPAFDKKIPKMTDPQLEAMRLWPECNANFAEMARRMGLTPKTVRQHYTAALAKLRAAGLPTPEQKSKTEPIAIPKDHRGQEDVYKDGDGQIREGRLHGHRRASGKRSEND